MRTTCHPPMSSTPTTMPFHDGNPIHVRACFHSAAPRSLSGPHSLGALVLTTLHLPPPSEPSFWDDRTPVHSAEGQPGLSAAELQKRWHLELGRKAKAQEATQLVTVSLPLVKYISLCRWLVSFVSGWLEMKQLQPSRGQGKPSAFPNNSSVPVLPLRLMRVTDSNREHRSGPCPAPSPEAGVPLAWLTCQSLLLALRVDVTLPQSR